MKKLGTAVLLLAVTIAADDAQACGEVMYRMGGALRYHAFITRHPAQILLYAGTVTRSAPSAEHELFQDSLEKAGHHVTVVNTPESFGKALEARQYDVIITYAGDLPAVQQQIAHVAHEPSLIPVLQRGDQESMRKQYPLALNEDANLNQFLKSIEQTMKARGT